MVCMLCPEALQIKNCATHNKEEEEEKTMGNSVISTLLVNKKKVSLLLRHPSISKGSP